MNIGRLVMGVFLWIWSGLGLAIRPVIEADCERHYCTAVIDVGSTGSRVHWYEYDQDKRHAPIHLREIGSKKITPGLAHVAHDSASIAAYMAQLMSDLSSSKTDVYVYATAGMRLLPEEEQHHYYTEIQRWFLEHPQWSLREARTITGMEEGVFGWLSLNYHLHTLQDKHKPLVGLLEVGGASAQVVFPIQNTTQVDAKDWMDIHLYGRHIQLFSHSFLGLGINELFAHSQEQVACFPDGYPLKNNLVGRGDAAQCQARVGAMLQEVHHMDTLFLPVLHVNSTPEWYVVAAVSTMVSAPPFELSASSFTGRSLLQQADIYYCQQPYQHLVERYPANDYMLKSCLLASYFYGLWVHGLAFSPDEPVHIAQDYDGSWTLGVLFGIQREPLRTTSLPSTL